MKLHLAGAENFYWCGKLGGGTSFLMSYFYAFHKARNTDEVLRILRNDPTDSWIMDSGLFTMMFGAESHKKYERKDLEAYTHRYIDTMQAIGYTGTIVEMDVHKILGMEALQDFRRIFEERWPLERTIFVYHIEEKIEGLRAMCKKYPYIALSIPELRKVVKHIPVKQYVYQLLVEAKKANPDVRIHLLGNTQPDLLMSDMYSTCDSTSWMYDMLTGTCSQLEIKGDQIKNHKVKWKDLKNLRQLYEAARNGRTIPSQEWLKRIESREYLMTCVIGANNFKKLEQYINEKFYRLKSLAT